MVDFEGYHGFENGLRRDLAEAEMGGIRSLFTVFILEITHTWVAIAKHNGPQNITLTVVNKIVPITAPKYAGQDDRFMEPF